MHLYPKLHEKLSTNDIRKSKMHFNSSIAHQYTLILNSSYLQFIRFRMLLCKVRTFQFIGQALYLEW